MTSNTTQAPAMSMGGATYAPAKILIQLNNTRTDALERFYHRLESYTTLQELRDSYGMKDQDTMLRLTEKEYAHFLLRWA